MESNIIKVIDEITNEFNYQIKNYNLKYIVDLVKIINSCQGNIYFSGVGKSGNMAKHCSDMVKCLSYPSFYLNILNATHGDIGTINEKDIIIFFSNSGNTTEVINLINVLKIKQVNIIGICSNIKSQFVTLCNKTIIIPFNQEISGEINKIPTNSCMSQLIFSNILVSILKNYISIEKYKINHLSGSIGKNLLKIKNVLIKEFPKIILEDEIELNKILLEMTKYKIGCCFFINKEDELLGILTDGDIRRLLINNNNIKCITINNINKNYHFETNINKYLSDCKKENYIPILKNNKLYGIITINY